MEHDFNNRNSQINGFRAYQNGGSEQSKMERNSEEATSRLGQILSENGKIGGKESESNQRTKTTGRNQVHKRKGGSQIVKPRAHLKHECA